MSRTENTENALRKRFEEQILATEKIEVGQQQCDVFDLKPETQEGVDPVVFIPGLGKTARDYADTLFELYKRGYRILSITPPTLSHQRMEEKSHQTTQKHPPIFELRAEAVQRLCTQKALPPTDVVTHSEGILHAVIAAGKNNSLFRNFIFVAPPSFAINSTTTVITRAVSNVIQGFGSRRQRTLGPAQPTASYSIGEAKAVIDAAIYPGKVSIINEVKALRDRGHKVAVIAYENDRMLPLEEFNTLIPTNESNDRIVDQFDSLPGTHDGLRDNPGVVGPFLNKTLKSFKENEQNQISAEERYRV